ncbi:MAG: hypothetical protein Q7J80_03875 [Anaerolineales bacterium]|nr:hypothetical protein [Anaerolineales bacterium]
MDTRRFQLISSGLVLLFMLPACAPKVTPNPVDVVGTRSAELASMMMTQTAAAYSPTPPPTFTSEPTATATIEPTPVVIRPPAIKNGPAACYVKPSTSSALTSNITDGKIVELLAIGATPGWYKILNPYFNTPCWVAENNLDLDNNMDLSTFPTE